MQLMWVVIKVVIAIGEIVIAEAVPLHRALTRLYQRLTGAL